MAVTLKDIAIECGVSYSTVSKALKDSPLVTEATKRKIKEKAEEMNYIPNNSARSLVSNKSNTIGLIWPAVDRVAVTTLASQINEAVKKAGYFMVVSIDDPITAAGKFLELRFDGVIVFDEGEETRLPAKITNNIPVVAYGVERELDYPIINVNHDKSMQLAVDTLMDKGHSEIDYIGDLETKDIRQIIKKETFIHYCEEKKVNYQLIDSEGLSEEVTSNSLRKYLANNTLKRGIVCGSYDITMGLLHHIDKQAEKPMIVSYDNIKKFDAIDTPVYTVGVPSEKIAESLVQMLIKHIEAEDIEEEQIIQLYPEVTYP
ncbi:LacI family DNA-binding transcriptional regulator [Oceanobacillus kimchii]|uniref:LacI family DNA-binding transcriptional regulator n=1 Tax=Oceanobacillus TaxID=182709 RepID=UPI00084E9AB9|nr:MULTISPECIES: LacI family DNA-binding transcriptional regulator [Oceanobacillus]MCT1577105.1 LacI family DNA-binding transcriptional regulator [Oceanobacillus kimchii]MCT2135175.1 LacI family DNA-binding transcriptional regulator [Oceanobacillus kimchii]OEH56445.1 transcriptional regulator [Oceanobacillus sp. E9]